jgi:mannosyltransferase
VARWLTAAGTAAVVLSPLLVAGVAQRGQLGWISRPGLHALNHLLVSLAGSSSLLPVLGLLAAVGAIASAAERPKAQLDMATVAVPWLVLPAAVLLVVSQIHPVYDFRYVVFSLPALALLGAAGVAWVTRFAAMIPFPGASATAWLPAALILVLLVALAAGPQRAVRLASSQADNLRAPAAVVAAHVRPGDAVLYMPETKRVVSIAYPAPFRRLRDVELGQTPAAAGNLTGTDVPAATLRARFAAVSRVWVVSGRRVSPQDPTLAEAAEAALLQPFRLVGRWHVSQDMISLYTRVPRG